METQSHAFFIDLRLDNRKILEQRYAPYGVKQNRDDGEFILALFERFGEDVLTHIRGGYAGVMLDKARNALALFRDPMGERPLFYTIRQHDVLFASSLPLLFQSSDIRKSPNLETLADYALYNFTIRENTPFQGIFRVPPGCVVSINIGGTKKTRSFHDWSPGQTVRLRSRLDYAEAIREKLETAVLRRICGARQVGSHLSSGLDSGTVSCLAASALNEHNKVLEGFTWVPSKGYARVNVSGRFSDERFLARDIAANNGNIRMHLVESPPVLHHPEIQECSMFMAAPDLMQMNPWYELIMEHAGRLGLDVMLAGFNGNFSFSHNASRSLSHLLRQRDIKGVWDQWFFSLDTDPFMLPRMVWQKARRLIQPKKTSGAGSSKPEKTLDSFTVENTDSALGRNATARAQTSGLTDFFEKKVDDVLSFRSQATVGKSWAADYWFHLEEKYGVTMREPTADQDLLEFCLAVPESQFINRGAARRLGRGILPPRVIGNRRRGLQNGTWPTHFSQSMDNFWTEVALMEQSDLANRILDVAKLKHLLELWPPSDMTSNEHFSTYMFAVLKGIFMGKYLRWMERFCG